MRITSTHSSKIDQIKMLVYGPSGAGKTYLASTLPGRTLVVSSESGHLSLRNHSLDLIDISIDENGRPIPLTDRFQEYGKVYRFLLSDEAQSKYDNIFIDSLTEISSNLHEALQVEYPDKKDSLVLYGENSKKIKALVKSFRDLPCYNVIFTALSEEEKDEVGRRFKTMSMIGKINQLLPAFFDEVFYLHTSVNDDGSTRRMLVTQPTENITAKDRAGVLDRFEPADLRVIFQKIRTINQVQTQTTKEVSL